MKMEFFNVIFSNEFRVSLDILDTLAYERVLHECPQQARIMRHQGALSVMFLTAMAGSTIIRPFQVTEGIKLNAQSSVIFYMTSYLLDLIKQSNARISDKAE